MRRHRKWVLAAVVAIGLAVPAGTFVYIHFIQGDPPPRLTLETTDSTEAAVAADTTTTTAVTTTTGGSTSGSGQYKATTGSLVGYRVKEVLFGQDTEAVGRTSQVIGSLTIAETTISAVTLSVDMTTVTSDSDRRDSQFQGRIMETSSFPTATFELTKPIELASTPADGTVITVSATGDLALHGTTKRVTFGLKAQRSGSTVKVNGSIPIVFSDYGIDNPSFGPATTQDHGELEFLVAFAPA